jgi:hypothetical protein
MLLGYFPILNSYKLFSFGKNQNHAAFFPYITRAMV